MDAIDEARQLAALAGITLPVEHEGALATGLQGMRRIAEALADRDYGEAEPAPRFRAPAPSRE